MVIEHHGTQSPTPGNCSLSLELLINGSENILSYEEPKFFLKWPYTCRKNLSLYELSSNHLPAQFIYRKRWNSSNTRNKKPPKIFDSTKTFYFVLLYFVKKAETCLVPPVHRKDLESPPSRSWLSCSWLRGFPHGRLCHTEEIGLIDYA